MAEKKHSILIVDDDAELTEALTEVLDKKGFKTHRSSSPSDAVQKLKNQKYDCVLLDLQLVGGSGEQVAQYINLDKGFNQNTPVLVISGHLEVEVIKRLKGLVATAIIKPFEIDALISKINELIKKSVPAS